jgi:dipeptidyl aminopeptidase/acylaminoacyl peptidase
MPDAKKRSGKRRPIRAEDLWRMARIGNVALAPGGRHVVCTVTRYSIDDNRGSTQLWRLATDGRTPPRQLTTVGEKCGAPAFSPKGNRIAFIAKRTSGGTEDDTPQIHLLPADGGEAVRASRFAPGIESFRWLDERRIVFAAWTWPDAKGAAAQAKRWKELKARKESAYVTDEAFYRYWDHDLPQGRRLQLWLLDIDSGRCRCLFEGPDGAGYELPRESGAEAYATSADGRQIAFVFDPDPVQRLGNRCAIAEIELGPGDAAGKARITRRVDDAAWDFGAPVYGPDSRTLAFHAAQVARAHTALAEPALQSPGEPWKLVATGWDHQANAGLRFAGDGRALLVAAEDHGRCHLWRLPLDGASAPTVVCRGGWVQGFDALRAEDGHETIVVLADSALHPPQVRVLREGQAEARRIEGFNDELLARLRLGAVREHHIKGAGGDAVQVWLTFPTGFTPRRKHAVTQVIHGGPFSAAGDTFSWRWNPHVFAARGDVIAQVNYHGSSGFGWAFRHSLIGRQGQLELQDIEAATDWLLKQPWADKRRLFATGGSYGGFMVAWMNGHLPAGRYRAMVCHAGVFDRVATFSADSYPQRPKDLGANWWQDMPRVLAQSPASFAAKMKTPTLVIHGARDYRVPDHNALAYYNTLKALGVPTRLLWFADENHWILKPQNSLQWYREFRAWLDAHDLQR